MKSLPVVEKDVVPGVSVMAPPGPVVKVGGVVCEPVRVAPPCRLTGRQEIGEGLAVGGLGLSTRAAAAAMSRFSFCAVSSRAGNSSALKFTHQLASGQIGDWVSTTGAVKALGMSPVRFRGVGLGVAQPAAVKASMLTERPRKIAFIEFSSN